MNEYNFDILFLFCGDPLTLPDFISKHFDIQYTLVPISKSCRIHYSKLHIVKSTLWYCIRSLRGIYIQRHIPMLNNFRVMSLKSKKGNNKFWLLSHVRNRDLISKLLIRARFYHINQDEKYYISIFYVYLAGVYKLMFFYNICVCLL